MAKQRFGNELHPLYARWLSTTQRCRNSNHVSYKNYGAKGIALDPALQGFKDYCTYIESLPNYDLLSGTVDRIDTIKGYMKGNLRWVNQSVQVANRLSSGKGHTTYTGVQWNSHHNRWVARINFEGKTLFTKVCREELDALEARNTYIREHNLPHPIQAIK